MIHIHSVAAEEGTAAHELSEYKIRNFLGISSKEPISEFYNDEMKSYTGVYVDFAIEVITEVRDRCKDAVVLVEQRLITHTMCQKGLVQCI